MPFRPEDRFQSVKQLQADVTAYQAGRATSAEQAGAWRQLKLMIARNKTLFSTIAVVFTILLAATAISIYQRQATLRSNRALQLTLHNASQADHETAHQRFRAGAWREGIALLGRSLTFWPENQQAANYLLSAVAFGHGDGDKLPVVGVYHDALVTDAAFDADGHAFVTASFDGTARVWDSATGSPIGKPLRHSAPVWCARFSPDGRKIVISDEHGSARVWDARTGEPLTKSMLHGKPKLDALSKVEAAVFSPDGRYVVTTSYDHTTRVWDAETGEQITELLNPNRASEVVFSPDGTRILGSCWRGATLWDARTFQQIGPFMNHGTTVKRSMFTPDGNKIVTGDLKNKVRIWDGHTAQPLTPFINVPEPVWDLDVSPDGKLFATAGWSKTAMLWSTIDGSPKGVPMEHQGPVDSAIFSPDGKRLLTSSRDTMVRLWDVATCKQIGNPMRHDESVLKAIFSPDETKILSVGADRAGYVWDTAPPHWPGEVIPTPGEICSVEFDNSDDGILVATRDGEIGLWSLAKNQFVTSIIRQGSPVAVAGFHVPSRQIATADNDGIIRFWDVVNGKKLGETAPAKDRIVGLEFATDGKSVFSAHYHGTVQQWKIPDGTQIGATIKLSENMDDGLARAPKGTEIATACGDDLFQFWDPATGKPSRKDIRHSTSAVVLNYHPDGQLIAAGCEDHTARIWSLDSGEQQGEPFYLNGRGTAVRFTPNGKAILVGGIEDTEVNCYDTKTHNSLYIPLPHPVGVSHITSNFDGSLIITVTNDGVARIWRIPTTSEPPPKWLPEYIRALGGLAFSPQQQLVQVPTRERLELRKKLLSQPPENTIWDKLMRWSFEQKPGPPPPVSSQ
jgi:WD40 repeat protein